MLVEKVLFLEKQFPWFQQVGVSLEFRIERIQLARELSTALLLGLLERLINHISNRIQVVTQPFYKNSISFSSLSNLLSNAAISLGNAFISLEISCSLLIIFSLFSFIFAWTFISLQIKEFRIMGLSINDSVYSLIIFCITLRIILSFKRIPVLTSLSHYHYQY